EIHPQPNGPGGFAEAACPLQMLRVAREPIDQEQSRPTCLCGHASHNPLRIYKLALAWVAWDGLASLLRLPHKLAGGHMHAPQPLRQAATLSGLPGTRRAHEVEDAPGRLWAVSSLHDAGCLQN